MADIMHFRVEYEHALKTDVPTVRLEAADLEDRRALGKALRAAGVLPKGASVRTRMRVGQRDYQLTMPSGPAFLYSHSIRLIRTDVWTHIGRGKAGWHAYRPGCASDGGTLEDMSGTTVFSACSYSTRAGYLSDAAEGAHVYDADGADYDRYVRHIVSGPIFNPGLADEQCDCFSKKDAEAAERMMPGLSGGFEVLAAAGIADLGRPAEKKYGSLDRVGWGIYRRLLEAVGGVKFGRVVNGRVVWEGRPA